MQILFIGGTGRISSACVQLAVERGIELTLLNRGQTDRPVPEGVTVLKGDVRDRGSVKQALGDRTLTRSSTGSHLRPTTSRPTWSCSAAARSSTSLSVPPLPITSRC